MRRVTEIVALAALVLVFYFALAYGIYSTVTSHMLGANDFYSRWEGARALFLRGENPYSDAVTREIQLGMYGRLALPTEDQVAFAYPLYSALVALPFIGMPYAPAQAMWMAFLTFAIAAASICLAQCYQATRPRQVALFVLGALLFYPSVRAIFNGQYAVVSFFCIALAIIFIASGHDVAGGVFAALSTVKPQTSLFLAPAIVVWGARNQRWRIVVSSAAVFAFLLITPIVLVPTWVFDFLQALRHYNEYEPVGPPLQIVIDSLVVDTAWQGAILALGLTVLVGWMVWRVARTIDFAWKDFLPTLGLVAIVTTIWAGRIGSSDQVLLLIPWAGWVNNWWRQGRMASAILGSLVVLILPWAVFLATLRGNAENVSVSLILPFLSLAVYLWQQARVKQHSQ
jgi:glycosyl transferase family 87